MSARHVYPVLVSILLTLTSCGGGGGGATVGGVWHLEFDGMISMPIVIWESGGKVFGVGDIYGDRITGTRSGNDLTLNIAIDELELKLTWDGANGLSGSYSDLFLGETGNCSGTKQAGSGMSGVWSYTDCNGNARTICLLEEDESIAGRADNGAEVSGFNEGADVLLGVEGADGSTTYMQVDPATGVGTMLCPDYSEKAVDMKRLDKAEQQNVTNVNQGSFDGQVNGSFSGSCAGNYGSGSTSGSYTMDVNPNGTFEMEFNGSDGGEWVTVEGTWQSANNTYAMMNGTGKSELAGTMTVKGNISLDAAKLGASGTFSSSGDYGIKCSGTF